MNRKLSRRQVLEKCLIVFDALKRIQSKGNAGLEPEQGAEEQWFLDTEICEQLREMIREMMSGGREPVQIREWQKVVMEHGAPERLTL